MKLKSIDSTKSCNTTEQNVLKVGGIDLDSEQVSKILKSSCKLDSVHFEAVIMAMKEMFLHLSVQEQYRFIVQHKMKFEDRPGRTKRQNCVYSFTQWLKGRSYNDLMRVFKHCSASKSITPVAAIAMLGEL